MLKLRSFLRSIVDCFYIKSIGKRFYRNAVILTAGAVIVAVVVLGSGNFGGNGRNVVYAAETETATQAAEEEDSTNEEPESETQEETLAEQLSEEDLTETRELIGQMLVEDVQDSVNRTPVVEYDNEDYDALLRIVEAEAGICDYTGKVLVANVVINRVKDERFPDTIKEVVYQKNGRTYQFSPVKSGRINRVEISEETYEAVHAALMGEDFSEGALFFSARKKSNPDSMEWFDRELQFLFEHDGHEFFTTKD